MSTYYPFLIKSVNCMHSEVNGQKNGQAYCQYFLLQDPQQQFLKMCVDKAYVSNLKSTISI
jgi:hypothetical protein